MDPSSSVLSYDQARLLYIEERKRKLEGSLRWWKRQKPYKRFDEMKIQEMCADLGVKISYYEDMIRLLTK